MPHTAFIGGAMKCTRFILLSEAGNIARVTSVLMCAVSQILDHLKILYNNYFHYFHCLWMDLFTKIILLVLIRYFRL